MSFPLLLPLSPAEEEGKSAEQIVGDPGILLSGNGNPSGYYNPLELQPQEPLGEEESSFERSLITLNDLSNYQASGLDWMETGVQNNNWLSFDPNASFGVPDAQTPLSSGLEEEEPSKLSSSSLDNFYGEEETDYQQMLADIALDPEEDEEEMATLVAPPAAVEGVQLLLPAPPPPAPPLPQKPEAEEEEEETDNDEEEEQKPLPRSPFTPRNCPHCAVEFTTPGKYESHLKSDHGVTHPYPCPTCGRTFARFYQLGAHQLIHDPDRYKGDPSWCCGHCDKKYHVRVSLYAHYKLSHPGQRPPKRQQQKPVRKVKSGLQQPGAQVTKTLKKNIQKRRKSLLHEDTGLPKPEVVRELVSKDECPQCPVPPRSRPPKKQKEETLNFLKLYKCRVCGKDDLHSSRELHNHRTTQHPEMPYDPDREKTFGCGVCLKPFMLREEALICALYAHNPEGPSPPPEKAAWVKARGLPEDDLAFHSPWYYDLTSWGPSPQEVKWLGPIMLRILETKRGTAGGDDVHVCTICGEELSRRGNFRRHLTLVHVKDWTPAPPPPTPPKNKKKTVRVVQITFSSDEEEEEEPEEGSPPPERKSFKCQYCEKVFPKRRALQFHEVRGHRNPKTSSVNVKDKRAVRKKLDNKVLRIVLQRVAVTPKPSKVEPMREIGQQKAAASEGRRSRSGRVVQKRSSTAKTPTPKKNKRGGEERQKKREEPEEGSAKLKASLKLDQVTRMMNFVVKRSTT